MVQPRAAVLKRCSVAVLEMLTLVPHPSPSESETAV